MHFVDARWQSLIPTLPTRFHEVAHTLPHRLGLSPNPAGAWTDFTKLEPMCDLPAFAAEAPARGGDPPLSEERLALFREAHCCAGYFGLLIDRLADGQASLHPDMPRLQPWLRRRWIDSLGRAMGDPVRARHLVRRSVIDWQHGLRHEAEHRLPGRWSAPDYGRCIRLKTGWLGATAVGLLETTGQRARVPAFLHAYELMLLALQTLDDGLDAQEDRRLYGVSYPDAIGLPPGVLVRASYLLCVRASGAASAGGFQRLGVWLREHAKQVRAVPAEGHPVVLGMGAMVLADELGAPS